MSEIVIKLPDIGEGIAEAEITEWQVEVGDWINEDDLLCVVMTDKAAVEIPSSAAGRVLWLAGHPGDMLAIGAPLVKISDEPAVETEPESDPPADTETELSETSQAERAQTAPADNETQPPVARTRTLAAAAVRARARDLGLDLAGIPASGPQGRVTHADLDRHLSASGSKPVSAPDGGITEIKVIGLRRKIAQQMARANERIPRITIVEEIDVTELETLRARMNDENAQDQPRLTILPFVIRGMIGARDAAPQINARYDDDAEILYRHDAMHIGVAVQTERGLMVPVLRQAQRRPVREIAAEITRLADAARDGSLARDELAGSTVTVTSLGPLGAIATTPIINAPEVAIVGLNRIQTRPLWDGHTFVPRKVMNVSASFDHRIVDGWDAAHFVARLKTLLETPALIFV